VGRIIVRAVGGEAGTYVTAADAAAVMVKNLSPRLIDWGMRRLWLSGRRRSSGAGENANYVPR
jgi:hypothetical protein